MKFKSHPYYDGSNALDWMSLRPDDWTELAPGPEKILHDLLRTHKPWLCELALERIRAAAGESYLSERPHPWAGDFQFCPSGEQGYRVYVEYFFYQRSDENSPDSDYWWAIIICPYAVPPFPGNRREANVIGFGWYVA